MGDHVVRRRGRPGQAIPGGLPQNWDVERNLIGGLLVNPEDNLETVRAIVRAEDFGKPAHKALFTAMCAVADRGMQPHIGVVVDHLTTTGTMEAAGGLVDVLAIYNLAHADPFALEHYAKVVRGHAARRAAILAVREAERRLFEDLDTEPTVILAEAQDQAGTHVASSTSPWRTLGDATAAALGQVRERVANPDHLPGIPTGWSDLDRQIAGWRPSRVYVIAARPKVGKTAFVLQTAIHAAELGHGVGFFSLEMAGDELGERVLASMARVDAGRMVRGETDLDDFRALMDADARCAGLPLRYIDQPAQTLAEIRAHAKRLRREFEAAGTRLGLLVIDYLQLMGGEAARGTTREQVVSGLSRGIKLLAKELDIPTLLLSQLNRSLEARTDKKPLLSDLRESGAIEQDADGILFLYRDELYNPETLKRGICDVIVAALRGGQAGTVQLAYVGSEYRFATLEARHDFGASLLPEAPTRRRRKGGSRGSAGPGDEHDHND